MFLVPFFTFFFFFTFTSDKSVESVEVEFGRGKKLFVENKFFSCFYFCQNLSYKERQNLKVSYLFILAFFWLVSFL